MNMKIYGEIVKRGIITEGEINLIKNRMKRGIYAPEPIFKNGALRITPEQTKKGLDWLMNLYKTPNGAIRKHNPFNKKHIAILQHFDHFELIFFASFGNAFVGRFLPVYRVVSKHGRTFDYVATWGNKNQPIKFYD